MLRLEFIEDWKDDDKINAIKEAINSGEINQHNINNILGNQSKKRYKDGTIVNDASFAIKKFFHPTIKEFMTRFYQKIDEIDNPDIKQQYTRIDLLIQTEVICRHKYNKKSLDEYRKRIEDIIYTRSIEEELYLTFYRKSYEDLVRNPMNRALQFILYHSWEETEQEYKWLTKLITFINNGSLDAKQYLVDLGVSDSNQDSVVINECCQIHNLDMKCKLVIISFIKSIGNYFKHGTYIKWYKKELDRIHLFEEIKNKTIHDIISVCSPELQLLFIEYYQILQQC